jgi:hypothetical protein
MPRAKHSIDVAFPARRYLRIVMERDLTAIPRPEWSNGVLATLAVAGCSRCYGTGITFERRLVTYERHVGTLYLSVCACALRRVFRDCYGRFLGIEFQNYRAYGPSIQFGRGIVGNGFSYSRRDEEFCADFCGIARRALDDSDWRLFQLRYLQRLPLAKCAKRFNTTRGNLIHAVYRIEAELGWAYRSNKPCALHPLGEYYNVRAAVVPHYAKPTKFRRIV